MKKRRRKRNTNRTYKTEYSGTDDMIYVYTKIHIYNRLALKDEVSDQNIGTIFGDCVRAVGVSDIKPSVWSRLDEPTIDCVITQPASDVPLQDMSLDAFVPVGGVLDQAFLAKVLQRRQEMAEEFAMATGEPVDLLDEDDPDGMEFRSEQIEDDTLRIGIVTCDAYSVSREPPPTNLFDPIINKPVALPILPLGTMQPLLHHFRSVIINASRLAEEPPVDVTYEGDGRWISAAATAPPPPAPDIEHEKSVELRGDRYRVWEITRDILESMRWEHGSRGVMRADPSSLFWKAWHADKNTMKNIGFQVYKRTAGWFVFVKDPSLIRLLRNLPH